MSWFGSEKPKRKPKRDDPPAGPTMPTPADRFSRSVLWAGIIVFTFAAISGLSVYFYWTFNTAPPPPTQSPFEIPTPLPTTVPSVATPVWQSWEILDVQTALGLREQRNVVNLALVDAHGRAHYADQSLRFTAAAPWTRAQRPFGWEALAIGGTTIALMYNGWSFPLQLNVLQPFVFENAASTVYLVSLDGALWSLPSDQADWIDIATVVASLPQELAANPNLSVSLESR